MPGPAMKTYQPKDTSLRVPKQDWSAQPIQRTLGADEKMMRRAIEPSHTEQWVQRYFGFRPMPFHLILDRILFGGGFWDIMLPTEHGKSTWCNLVFPVKSLANNPEAAHAIVGTNVSDAKRWLRAIQIQLETNTDLLIDYPWLKKPGPKNRVWSTTAFTISGRTTGRNDQNPSVSAFGEGSGDTRGRRAITILDDIEGPKHRESATARTSTMHWLTLQAMRLFEDPGTGMAPTDRPLLANVGTPYDMDSIHFQLARSNSFQVYRQPYKYADGKLIWPAKREKVIEFYKHWTKEEFYIAMCLDPSGGDPHAMTMEKMIEHATVGTPWVGDIPAYGCIDPASGSQNRRADYAGLTINRYIFPDRSLFPRVETLEAMKCTLGPVEQVHIMGAWAKRYNADVIIEGNNLQWATYRSFFRLLYPDIRLHRWDTNEKNKWDSRMGVQVMRTLLNEGYWKLVDIQGHPDMQVVMREVMALGQPGAHDHLTMSVWIGARKLYELVKPRVTGSRKLNYTFRRPYALRGSA